MNGVSPSAQERRPQMPFCFFLEMSVMRNDQVLDLHRVVLSDIYSTSISTLSSDHAGRDWDYNNQSGMKGDEGPR